MMKYPQGDGTINRDAGLDIGRPGDAILELAKALDSQAADRTQHDARPDLWPELCFWFQVVRHCCLLAAVSATQLARRSSDDDTMVFCAP